MADKKGPSESEIESLCSRVAVLGSLNSNSVEIKIKLVKMLGGWQQSSLVSDEIEIESSHIV